VQGGADKDAITGCLAENVVLIGPLSDEPLTGREAGKLERFAGSGIDEAFVDAFAQFPSLDQMLDFASQVIARTGR
jgi:hypothetical protein